eukprot:1753581-Pleurochrysis_carterae.AAC.2
MHKLCMRSVNEPAVARSRRLHLQERANPSACHSRAASLCPFDRSEDAPPSPASCCPPARARARKQSERGTHARTHARTHTRSHAPPRAPCKGTTCSLSK